MSCNYEIERKLLKKYSHIAGVDEVGRGALAGPVVSAMVILDPDHYLHHLSDINDSKKLSMEKREKLSMEIIQTSLSYAISEVSEKEIDKTDILKATKKSVVRSWQSIKIRPECLLLDAFTVEEISIPQYAYTKGDTKSYSIAAASILAKVFRDRIMMEWDQRYPQYGFKNHKGYGVKNHLEKIKELGPCPIHRRSFAPIKQLF